MSVCFLEVGGISAKKVFNIFVSVCSCVHALVCLYMRAFVGDFVALAVEDSGIECISVVFLVCFFISVCARQCAVSFVSISFEIDYPTHPPSPSVVACFFLVVS